MTFAAKGLGISLDFFILSYLLGSLAVVLLWKPSYFLMRRQNSRRIADALFLLRTSPFVMATALTFVFAIPSFLLLEPQKALRESPKPLFLEACCLAVVAFGMLRALWAQRKTSRAIAVWLHGSSPLSVHLDSLKRDVGLFLTVGAFPFGLALLFTVGFTFPSYLLLDSRASDEAICLPPLVLATSCLLIFSMGIARVLTEARAACSYGLGASPLNLDGSVPVFRTSLGTPSLTVAGISSPKVIISERAIAALCPSELTTALKHEIAHVQSADNFKKLLFRCLEFPGMAGLEKAWAEATEFAADDAAVSTPAEALDLASALIKISRLATAVQAPALVSGLMPNPSALSTRVQRLFAWHAKPTESADTFWYTVPPAIGALAAIIVFYGAILLRIHTVTEWLIR